jgi:KUP system potassium uptake protein
VILFLVMTTWHSGIEALRLRWGSMTEPLEQFLNRLQHNQIPRVPAAAVFLTRQVSGTPLLMIEHLAQLGSLPQVLIMLTVKFEDFPRVLGPGRFTLLQVVEGYWHITLHYGFFEVELPRFGRRCWAAVRTVLTFGVLVVNG